METAKIHHFRPLSTRPPRFSLSLFTNLETALPLSQPGALAGSSDMMGIPESGALDGETVGCVVVDDLVDPQPQRERHLHLPTQL